MRLTILGLLFCAGTTVLCQTTPPAPAAPDGLWQGPNAVTPPARDFSKLPPGWQASAVVPWRALIQPKAPEAETGSRLGNAKIDPRIIVHPPQSNISVNPPGTPMAQNEFPHLQMLPIEAPTQVNEK
jgi:hypothetical protein